jgi:hypothetical protein
VRSISFYYHFLSFLVGVRWGYFLTATTFDTSFEILFVLRVVKEEEECHIPSNFNNNARTQPRKVELVLLAPIKVLQKAVHWPPGTARSQKTAQWLKLLCVAFV